MRKKTVSFFLLGGLLLVQFACQQFSSRRTPSPAGFRVEQIHIQPSFTKIRPATSTSDAVKTIETYVQLRDQFGDPIKALGHFRFEFFRHRPAFSDPRGQRFPVDGIQEIDLSDLARNQQFWDGITRSYRLDLKLPEMSAQITHFVLQATFIADPDYRLQDILVIERAQ